MSYKPPFPLDSFSAVLDAYLYVYVSRSLLSESYDEAWLDANPDGYSHGPSDRDALLGLLIAFAVKEREDMA